MSAENKTSLQDNFAITADLVSLDVAAKKAKAGGVLVTIAAREQLRQKMHHAGKTIYAIVDLSDSTGQTAGQMAHVLTEIVDGIDLFRNRLLIYPLGKSAPLTLAGMSEAEAKVQLKKFNRETGADHYDRRGTFIDPTLQAIRQDHQSRRRDEPPVLLIFSDAEIWDWELYRDFLEGHQSFRVSFLEAGSNHAQNKIVEQVRLVNKQHAVLNAKTAADLLDNVLPAPTASQAVIEDISLRISFDQLEPFGVMDLREKRMLEQDGNKFKWQAALPTAFFQRLYLFCPDKPKSLRLHDLADEEITVAIDARAKTLAEVLPREDERKRCLQLAEQKCAAAWAWNQPLLEILIHALLANESLPEAPFTLDCPNTEKKVCGVTNKPEHWIFREKHSVLCRNCRQILLHTTKLETTDPKLHGANNLLLKIKFLPPTQTIVIVDEPIGFNANEAQAKEIANFKIYGREKATAVVYGQLQHYKLAAVDGAFKYESAVVQANGELQLASFDFVKPLLENSAAPDAPEIYYLFMDISKII